MSGEYLISPLLPFIFLVWTKLQLTCVEQQAEVPSLPATGGINGSARSPLSLSRPPAVAWGALSAPSPALLSAPFLCTAACPRTSKECLRGEGYKKRLAKGMYLHPRCLALMLWEEKREQRCGPWRRQPRCAGPRTTLPPSDAHTHK